MFSLQDFCVPVSRDMFVVEDLQCVGGSSACLLFVWVHSTAPLFIFMSWILDCRLTYKIIICGARELDPESSLTAVGDESSIHFIM